MVSRNVMGSLLCENYKLRFVTSSSTHNARVVDPKLQQSEYTRISFFSSFLSTYPSFFYQIKLNLYH
jgi:hypothetical protein